MTSAARLRALIVDDEPPARAFLRRMLGDHADIEVAGECSNGTQAAALVKALRPDLVFLDIQMPGSDGIAFAESLDPRDAPAIVFVTAHDRYAVRAFELAAVDYLLKPYDDQRLAKALARARSSLREHSSEERADKMLSLLAHLESQAEYLDRFVVRQQGRVYLVRADHVEWIAANGNYLLLHEGKDRHMIRETMQNVERRLNPRKFVRIHRSAIVNIDCIREIRKQGDDEEQQVVLKDGTELVLSRGYRDKVSKALGAVI
jgi:two-component system LytT family response regulator